MSSRTHSAALEALYDLLGQAQQRRDMAAISEVSKKIAEVIVLIKGTD